VTTREGSTPALVRALRAETIDLALLAAAPPFRPPDSETPALHLQPRLQCHDVARSDPGRHLLAQLLRTGHLESHGVQPAAHRSRRWVELGIVQLQPATGRCDRHHRGD